MNERYRVPVGGENRDALSVRRDCPSEGDVSGNRSLHGPTCRAADVDTSMLTTGIRMRRVERERRNNNAIDRPNPCRGRRRLSWLTHHREQEEDDKREPSHGTTSVLSNERTSVRHSRGALCALSILVTEVLQRPLQAVAIEVVS